jgi:ATP-dependent Clp protease ATP-binding subunit ClpC
MSQYRYSDRAIRALVLARDDARVLGHGHIGTEHVLLGLIQESLGTASKLLQATGITRDLVFDAVRDTVGRGPGAPSGHIPFTPRVKKVIRLAHTSSVDDSSSHVGTEHILIGLLREGDGVAIEILKRLRVDVGALSQRANTKRYS